MSGTRRVLVLEPESYAEGAASRIAQTLARAIEERGRASWALSGGGTPRPVYELLAARAGIDWSRIEIFFADERAVEPTHEDSSFRMVQASLIQPLGDRAPGIVRMEGEDPNPFAAAERYMDQLPARLDLGLLGMGPDGHTASLFPGRDKDWGRRETVRVVSESPKPPPVRLTLSPEYLALSRELIVLARGADKSERVAASLDPATDPIACPAALAAGGLWILDPPAASDLSVSPESNVR